MSGIIGAVGNIPKEQSFKEICDTYNVVCIEVLIKKMIWQQII